MNIQESGEMYLETIYILSIDNPNVRMIDVAEYMHYSKPSITRGIKLLKNADLVANDENGYLYLTETGKEIASKIYERHIFLTDFFKKIGVPEDIASEDACKIEHQISDTTFKALKDYLNKK